MASVMGQPAKATAIAVPTWSSLGRQSRGQQRQKGIVVGLRCPDPGVAAGLQVAGGGLDVVDPGDSSAASRSTYRPAPPEGS